MKIKILLYCILFLLIISCSKHAVQPPAELANGRVTGTVHGLVYDYATQSLFDSAEVTVTWVVDGATHSTYINSQGYYIITDLPPGDYTIKFRHSSDYAVGQIVVHVPTLEEILYSTGSFGSPPPTDRDYEHTVSQDISLYQRNAGVQGTVYKKEGKDLTSLADGVTVIADHEIDDHDSYNIHPNSYTTITNNSGFFSFDSLPCTPDVVIKTLPYNDGTNEYACFQRTETLCKNNTKTIKDIILTINAPKPFITQNNFFNVYNFPIDQDLTCTFSKPMLTADNFKYILENDDISEMIECDTSWTHNLTLTIDPYENLLTGTSYTLSLYGESTDGFGFFMDTTFYTQEGIELVATNLERIEGIYDQFPVDDDITLTFSMAVNLNNPDMVLYLEDGSGNPVYFDTPSLSPDSRTITLAHTDNPLEPEQDYNLIYDIYSTIAGDHVANTIAFTTASTDQVPGPITGFRIISPDDDDIDWNTGSSGNPITLRWYTLESADWYVIFAEDDYKNTDRIYIDAVDDIDYMVRQTATFTLPSEFDYYQDDVYQTPFLYGTEVTFHIMAGNDAGNGPLTSMAPLSDTEGPSFNTPLTQSSTADNDPSGGYKNITVTFSVSEYIVNVSYSFDTSTGPLDDGDIIGFSWNSTNNDKMGGTITIRIPEDVDAVGQELDITCEDTSTNSNTYTYTLW